MKTNYRPTVVLIEYLDNHTSLVFNVSGNYRAVVEELVSGILQYYQDKIRVEISSGVDLGTKA